jgi:hypothetical protein
MAKRRRGIDRFSRDMEIALVTLSPWQDLDVSMQEEMRRVRAAVMYAERVRVFSYLPTLLLNVRAIEASGRSPAEFLALLPNEVLDRIVGSPIDSIDRRLRHRARHELRGSAAGRANSGRLEEVLIRLRSSGWTLATDPKSATDVDDMERLLEEGILIVDAQGLELSDVGDELPEEYGAVLGDVLSRNHSYPLFDETTSWLVGDLITKGHLDPSSTDLSRALRTATGAGMILRLPAFPDAPLDDLLEARADLHGHLHSYRKGIAELSEQLQDRQFTPSFSRELDDLYREKVGPAVSELYDAMRLTSVVERTATELGTDAKSWMNRFVAGTSGTSAVSLLPGNALPDLTELLRTVAGAGVATGSVLSATAGAMALSNYVKGRAAAQEDDFVYLLELGRRLDRPIS